MHLFDNCISQAKINKQINISVYCTDISPKRNHPNAYNLLARGFNWILIWHFSYSAANLEHPIFAIFAVPKKQNKQIYEVKNEKIIYV